MTADLYEKLYIRILVLSHAGVFNRRCFAAPCYTMARRCFGLRFKPSVPSAMFTKFGLQSNVLEMPRLYLLKPHGYWRIYTSSAILVCMYRTLN